jgi:hypothetical protein
VFLLTASIKRNSIRSPGPMLRSYEAAAKLPAASSPVRVVSTSHHRLSLSQCTNPPFHPPPPPPPPRCNNILLLLLLLLEVFVLCVRVCECVLRSVLTIASCSCTTRQAFLQMHPLMWQLSWLYAWKLGGMPLASCLTYINPGMRFTGPGGERSRGLLTSASCSCTT